MMRSLKSIGACIAAITTLGLVAVISAGSASALPSNPAAASPPAFPSVQLNAAPVGVAVDPGNDLVYVTSPVGDGAGELSVIDAATLGPPGSLSAPSTPPVLLEQLAVGGHPSYAGVDTSTHIAYVSDANGGTPINGATDPRRWAPLSPVALVQPGPVTVDSTTHSVYVVDANSPDIEVVDAAANSPTATTVDTAETPTGIAVDPTTHLVYVTEQADDVLQVIAGADNPPQVIHTSTWATRPTAPTPAPNPTRWLSTQPPTRYM
jgi:DNA-binding beta-propeller fold protein YncE